MTKKYLYVKLKNPRTREIFTVSTPRGQVEFEMYTSRKRERWPKILVEHKGRHAFELRNIADIWMTLEDVFASGNIQGFIRLDFCTLTADRRGFEWDDDFDSFFSALEEFCQEYGRPFLEDIQDVTRQERWSEIAREVIGQAEDIFKGDPSLLPSGLSGLVSKGHSGVEDTNETSHQTREKIQDSKKPKKLTLGEAKKHRKKLRHHSVGSGRQGTPRRRLKGEAGLTIEFAEPTVERGYRWRVMVEEGMILFNTQHQDWREAEDGGKTRLRAYLVILLIQVLSEFSLPEEWRGVFSDCFEQVVKWHQLLVPAKK